MPSLSAVIITYNEEKNIGRCLDSLKDVADEIVVVDSYSSDRTEELCRQRAAVFLQHPFEGHIQQKNYAITRASHPHILSLDADEALTHELREEIGKVKNNWNADGYLLNRMTYYCGCWMRYGSWYPDRKLRLFDSRKGSWQGQNPHDRYELEIGSKTARLKGNLLHYSYYTISEHLKQIEKFSEIASMVIYERGLRLSLCKAMYKSFWRFFRDYFLKLGFMNGVAGYQVYRTEAFQTYTKYIKALYLAKYHTPGPTVCLNPAVGLTGKELEAFLARGAQTAVEKKLSVWVLLKDPASRESTVQRAGMKVIPSPGDTGARLRRILRRNNVRFLITGKDHTAAGKMAGTARNLGIEIIEL